MAPISLDEYRKNQPPGRRRPKSSTAALPPEQNPSAPAVSREAGRADPALEPTGEFQAVRSTAARLTTSAEELLTEPTSAPSPPPAADTYMDALLERQAAADPDGQAQPVEPDSHVDTNLEAPTELDEQDRFFRELGHQPPQPLRNRL